MTKATCFLGLLVLAVSIAGVARAQGSDPAAADALFREARALMKKGAHEAACPKLAESQRLDPAPGTAVSIGECLEKLGRLADALQAYRDALDLMRTGDDRIAPVKAQVSALEKRVPRLTVAMVAGAPGGTKVVRDGVELGEASMGAALPVNPGQHIIEVTAPGHEPRKHVVKLGEGETRELRVEPGAPTQPTSPTADSTTPAEAGPRDSANGSRARTAGYIVGAVGLTGVAIGVVAFSVATAHCGFWRSDCEPAEREDAQSWQTPAIGFFVGGAVVAATGAVLVLTAKPDGSALRVAPTFAMGRAACVLEGRW